ncbi:hypothetical protein [Streptomyces formicae]|uniref:Proline rich protein membrane protein n=1 Tax=Streptomyces formicae TaxID=1616117 RepID=A0ABY3WM30_9ACTN|nr:hypothetical protein [Streptomyces formicae]UNM13669.1 hypothetical protein J4032_21390 [Streptomyces formicae]
MSAQGSPYASGPRPPHQEHPSEGANPLRRSSDRIESWFRRLLMLVLALGLPAASVSAGLAAYESSMRTVHAQSAERQAITARVVSDARGDGARGGDEARGGAKDVWQWAQVRWTGTDGKERTGTARVEPGATEGATVRVWLGPDGTLRSPPMTADNATATGWLVGGMTAVAVSAGVFAARAGMRRMLDRGRAAQWDAEWDLVEPSWSARFRQ